MVNPGMVNAPARCLPHPHFAKISRVFARYPRFKNPVKYIRGFQVNYIAVHFAACTTPGHRKERSNINALYPR